ncbi:cyclitol dehydrogenase domain protein [Mycobacterium ulcerans str. Harvey]|uniref:Cyclitol dehydrogenase domain protein n=1 Tax=Mycobacterium ulcerans str. Harvey TaxID=1299332 RepID=A0ABP3AS51_MYCUL|nr:cyclitol dehydrogenase domain protein [Mycobacterium ulcerans str. Harvey]
MVEGLGSHYERESREQLRGGSCYADRGFSESWLDERLVFCADSSADIDCLRCTAHVRRAAQGDRMTDNGYRALVRRPAGPDGCSLVDVAVLDTPALEPGDLLLAPLVAGICGTDWQILRGDRPDDSPVLGHEASRESWWDRRRLRPAISSPSIRRTRRTRAFSWDTTWPGCGPSGPEFPPAS